MPCVIARHWTPERDHLADQIWNVVMTGVAVAEVENADVSRFDSLGFRSLVLSRFLTGEFDRLLPGHRLRRLLFSATAHRQDACDERHPTPCAVHHLSALVGE